ncbi:MAG: hypothetical protein OES32_04670 [Acidobacteriota bacterium]|nr:hypothetical protein [Acidobacteriota bacterium]
MKRKIVVSVVALALTFALGALAQPDQGSWTGEVVDLACYLSQGAHGADHAGCAKSCVKNGQPMGLLTSEGDLVLLAADHKEGAPYEALKDLAGEKAEVKGVLSEKDGMKLVTVTAARAAG